MTLNGKQVKALVDTGATLSLIESSFVDVMPLPAVNKVCAGTVGGVKIHLTEIATQPFTLTDIYEQSHSFIHDFFIIDNLHLHDIQVIIGLDAIESLNFALIPVNNKLRLYREGIELPLIGIEKDYAVAIWEEENSEGEVNKQMEVMVNHGEREIPPLSGMEIVGKVPEVLNNRSVLIWPFGPYGDFLSDGQVGYVEGGLIDILFYNFTNETIVVKENEVLAKLEVVELCSVNALEELESDNRIEKLQEIAKRNTPEKYSKEIADLINSFHDTFSLPQEPPGFCEKFSVKIDTGDTPPIAGYAYRVPLCHQEEVGRQIKELLDSQIITHSNSTWRSPLVVVRKKDGSLRLCVDYRKLNRVTRDDLFPLPSIEEMLGKLKGNQYFSSLDLKSGYYQVALDPESQQKTAFLALDCLYEFKRLPFGLKNGPGCFSRLMQSVLAGIIGVACLVYLDDIIILGRTWQEHLQNLIKVLVALRKFKLKLSIKKCFFFRKKIEFLGHIIGREGIHPQVDKVRAIKDFPIPKNARQVQSFLGLSGYYRRFIRDYGSISKPLDELRHVNIKNFIWREEHSRAFQSLKDKIQEEAVLIYPDVSKVFRVTADASNFAIGGVVSQMDTENRDRPISFASRSLTNAERNWSATERECLALKFMLERHRYFLLGHRIQICSDHRPLLALFNGGKVAPRLARWLEIFLEFNIEGFSYVKGRLNYVADALSRVEEGYKERNEKGNFINDHQACVITRTQAKKEGISAGHEGSEVNGDEPSEHMDNGSQADSRKGEIESESNIQMYDSTLVWEVKDMIKAQKEDPLIGRTREYKGGKRDKLPNGACMNEAEYVIENDVLYVLGHEKGKVVYRCYIPPPFVELALRICHSSPWVGHSGVEGTLSRARQYFYWKGFREDIKNYINSCHICNLIKSHRLKVPPARVWPICKDKWERVHIDLIGPLPRSEIFKYIFVITDAFTRFTWIHPMEDKSAISVAKAITKFMGTFSAPEIIISDNGAEFNNRMITEFMRLNKCKFKTVIAYRPSSNGLVESKNKQIVSILRQLVSEDRTNWADKLDLVMLALNSAVNRSVGETPYFLMYNRDAQIPIDCFKKSYRAVYNLEDYITFAMNSQKQVYEIVKRNLEIAQKRYAKEYDSRLKTAVADIRVGSRVYVKRCRPKVDKLETPFVGPFRVLEIEKDKITIRYLATKKIYNVHRSIVRIVNEKELRKTDNKNVGEIFPYKDVVGEEILAGLERP